MGRKLTSPIWRITKEDFEALVNKSRTIGDILSYFGLKNHGSNYQTLVRRLKHEQIEYSRFKENKRKSSTLRQLPLNQVLVDNSTYSRHNLKKRLLQNGLLENKCAKCGLGPSWEGESLVMVLDHINGKNDDNRIENLRMLCPNCNSQSSTFAGRNHKKRYNCNSCGVIMGRNTERCKDCRVKNKHAPKLWNRRVVDRPSKEELSKMLWEIPTSTIAKNFGVSDAAICKWAKSYGLEKPPRGYWAKVYSRVV